MKEFTTLAILMFITTPMFLGLFAFGYLIALLFGVLTVKIVTATAIYFSIEPTWLLFSLSISSLSVALSSSISRLKK